MIDKKTECSKKHRNKVLFLGFSVWFLKIVFISIPIHVILVSVLLIQINKIIVIKTECRSLNVRRISTNL